MTARNVAYKGVRIAAYLWAAPCSATGLALALPGLLLGGTARLLDGTIEISLAGPLRRLGLHRLPFRAISFGHVIIGVSRASLRRLRSHELVHVRQYEQWGLLFFIAYPLSSLIQLLRRRRPYRDNWFELQACARASTSTPANMADSLAYTKASTDPAFRDVDQRKA
jgi:hypothetical protein